jgi:hypothetical protein
MIHQLGFRELAPRLVFEQGISVLPAIPAEKTPGSFATHSWVAMTGWNEFKTRLPTRSEIDSWISWPDPNIGVLTGRLSGIVAVDFDKRGELHPALYALLPPSPVRKRGAHGFSAFYRFSGEPRRRWKLADDTVIEILSESFCVIPPSVHPTGLVYEWIGEEDLLSVRPSDLPALPGNVCELLDDFFSLIDPERRNRPVSVPRIVQRASCDGYPETSLDRVKDALKFIPAEDYDTWIRVGMAIHSAFPGDDGLAAWDAWSQTSAKYHDNRSRGVDRKWASFRSNSGGGITLGTLFRLAFDGGFRNAPNSSGISERPNVVIDFDSLSRSSRARQESESLTPAPPPMPGGRLALPVELLTSAPGLVGEIADWLARSNSYWQPSYGLAAALAFVGMCKGHRVKTETNFRTNLLCVAVGPSSSGKSMPIKRVQELAALAGLQRHMCGEPVSDNGLVKSLVQAGHKGFVPWDEVGLAFKSMFAVRAPSYTAAIARRMLQIFSAADTVLLGAQYASQDDDKNPRLDLHEPCLCLYGTSTEDGIYGAISSVQAANGFAARLLVFETHDYTPPRQKFRDTTPPADLVAKVRAISGVGGPTEGNLAGVLSVPLAALVPFTKEAEAAIELASQEFERRKNIAIRGRQSAIESIWGRAFEHASKIALTVEDGPEITLASVEWAVALVTKLSENLAEVVTERVADNETHADLNMVLRIIKEAAPGWVSTTDLYGKTRRLGRRQRQEILASLVEEGQIELNCSQDGGAGRPITKYRLVAR